MLNREFHFRFRSGCWRETPSPTGHICGDEGLSSAVVSGYPGADTYNIFSHIYFLLCWEESNLHLVLAIQSKKSIKWPSVNRLRVHFWLKYPFNRSRLLPFRDPSYFCRATLSNQTFEKNTTTKTPATQSFPLISTTPEWKRRQQKHLQISNSLQCNPSIPFYCHQHACSVFSVSAVSSSENASLRVFHCGLLLVVLVWACSVSMLCRNEAEQLHSTYHQPPAHVRKLLPKVITPSALWVCPPSSHCIHTSFTTLREKKRLVR